jgi:hypothetical protein
MAKKFGEIATFAEEFLGHFRETVFLRNMCRGGLISSEMVPGMSGLDGEREIGFLAPIGYVPIRLEQVELR